MCGNQTIGCAAARIQTARVAVFRCFLGFVWYCRGMKKNKNNFMDKNWVGISAIGCTAAALLALGVAWKKQHEMVQLQLGEKHSKNWIDNEYRRHDKIKELDMQSKVWSGVTAALISWPFVVMFYVDVTNAGARARMRRVKRKMVQRQK